MQITVNRKEFADAVAWAHKGLPRRPVVPVLQGILVSVNNSLALSTFDYERAHRAFVAPSSPGVATEPGSILVDGAAFKKAVSALPKGKNVPVTLDTYGDGSAEEPVYLSIHAGGVSYTVPSLPAEEYPELPPMPRIAGVVGGDAFARSVLRVAAAAGTDDTLPMLLCIAFKPRKGYLQMEATDRYRLAVDKVPWMVSDDERSQLWTGDHVQFLVPAGLTGYYRNGVAAFAKGAAKSKTVTVAFGTGPGAAEFAGFSDGWHELIMRTNSGEWIKATRMIDKWAKESEVTLSADAAALAAIVRNAGRVTEKNVAVMLHYADGELSVSGQAGGRFTMTRSLPAKSSAGDFWVGFNPEYLASMLEGFDGEVRIGLSGTLPQNPKVSVIRSKNTKADPFTVGVVPVRNSEWKPPAEETPQAA